MHTCAPLAILRGQHVRLLSTSPADFKAHLRTLFADAGLAVAAATPAASNAKPASAVAAAERAADAPMTIATMLKEGGGELVRAKSAGDGGGKGGGPPAASAAPPPPPTATPAVQPPTTTGAAVVVTGDVDLLQAKDLRLLKRLERIAGSMAAPLGTKEIESLRLMVSSALSGDANLGACIGRTLQGVTSTVPENTPNKALKVLRALAVELLAELAGAPKGAAEPA